MKYDFWLGIFNFKLNYQCPYSTETCRFFNFETFCLDSISSCFDNHEIDYAEPFRQVFISSHNFIDSLFTDALKYFFFD